MGEPGAAAAAARMTSTSDSGVDLSTEVFREVGESAPPTDWDDWELGQQMRRVRRLASAPPTPPRHTSWDPQNVVRYDAPHGRHSERVPPADAPSQEPSRAELPVEPARRGLAAWITLALGLAVSACGGLLMAQSLFVGREDLWRIGLPLLAAGQSALAVGLALQVLLGRQPAPRRTGRRSRRTPCPGGKATPVVEGHRRP